MNCYFQQKNSFILHILKIKFFKDFIDTQKNNQPLKEGLHLPILSDTLEFTQKFLLPKISINPENTYLISSGQHLMDTHTPLIRAFIESGLFLPENIYSVPKHYSAHQGAINDLIALGTYVHPIEHQYHWGKFTEYFKKDVAGLWSVFEKKTQGKPIEKLIVLDDGGYGISTIPESIQKRAENHEFHIAAVEQTTAGMRQQGVIKFPSNLVPVSLSAVKKLLESPLIIEAALDRLNDIPLLTKGGAKCGVVGDRGAIGGAMAEKLIKLGHKVYAYDNKQHDSKKIDGVEDCKRLDDLLKKADYVFGCTGEDITAGVDWTQLEKNICLISCSSGEIEFHSLIKQIQSVDFRTVPKPLEHVIVQTKSGAYVKLYNGGKPINFNGTKYSVIPEKIDLTRSLLYVGVIQAMLEEQPSFDLKERSVENKHHHMLDPHYQLFIAQKFLKKFPEYNKSEYDFSSIDFIKKHSGGTYIESPIIKSAFEQLEYSKITSNNSSTSNKRKNCKTGSSGDITSIRNTSFFSHSPQLYISEEPNYQREFTKS